MTDALIEGPIGGPTDARIDQVERAPTPFPPMPLKPSAISWDTTTMVPVRARSGDVESFGWTCVPSACAT